MCLPGLPPKDKREDCAGVGGPKQASKSVHMWYVRVYKILKLIY